MLQIWIYAIVISILYFFSQELRNYGGKGAYHVPEKQLGAVYSFIFIGWLIGFSTIG